MNEESALKCLSRETKALILVSEFEARRMPMFQMRAVLDEIVSNEEEKKIIIDLVENDLKATGYHPNQIMSFLNDLLSESPAAAEPNLQVTRRLRSPFARSFEEHVPAAQGAAPGGGERPAPPAFPAPAAVPGGGPAAPSTPPSAPAKPAAAVFAPGDSGGARVAAAAPAPGLLRPKVPAATPAGATEVGQTVIRRPGQVKGTAQKDPLFFGNSPIGISGAQLQGKKLRVLLADDDKRIRVVFRLNLERMGFEVIEVGDGTEAWRRIQKSDLALAVLDMKMPGLHGLEVLSRMVDQQMNLPVVICSAYDQLKDEFVVATYPRLRYLVKPVATETLTKAVKELTGVAAE